jgi:hypothetical protein
LANFICVLFGTKESYFDSKFKFLLIRISRDHISLQYKSYHFSFEEQSLELVSEYEYLGIIFKLSGSFSFAINYLSKKTAKAMFCIRKTLYSEKRNAFLHLRLFDDCVKPILLYCSEIWSLDILIKRNLNFESKYDSFSILHSCRIKVDIRYIRFH